MTDIYSLTVVRNEADRYLAQMLDALVPAVDGSFVFDDCSIDTTRDLAKGAGCTVIQRADTTPSFLEHEGRFRQAAWRSFQACMSPSPGDWVFSVDADEMLTSNGNPGETIHALVAVADVWGKWSVPIRIPEVFGTDDDGCPMIRMDGFWNTIVANRLFAFDGPDAQFRDRAMGCGSAPVYVDAMPQAHEATDVFLLHYGYAASADRKAKHERYTALANHGHSDAHVQSITGRSTLVRWDGPWQPVEVAA